MGDANSNSVSNGATSGGPSKAAMLYAEAIEQAKALNDTLTDEEYNKIVSGLSNEDAYRIFAINLLVEGGNIDLDNPEGEEMIDQIVMRLEAFVSQELMMALPDRQSEELDGLINLNQASTEEIEKLFKDAGLDTKEIIGKALDKFRRIYLGLEEQE